MVVQCMVSLIRGVARLSEMDELIYPKVLLHATNSHKMQMNFKYIYLKYIVF